MNSPDKFDRVRALEFTGEHLRLLDQRILPLGNQWLEYDNAEGVAQAIRALVVRGAPAIGIAAAYGLVLESRRHPGLSGPSLRLAMADAFGALRESRPTAVNLFWALERMDRTLAAGADVSALLAEARAIEAEDLAANRRMGALGAELLGTHAGVLTHCNTGSLATAGMGTALGVIRHGWAEGRIREVHACETRPWLQGARLTIWELLQDGIPATLVADSAASWLMAQGKVDWVVVGADRIAANGDVANKIGTYQLAIAARHHGARFMVVAPSSTVDMATPAGSAIEIELRDPRELMAYGDQRTVAEGARAWNPVFDVTPAALIDAIVTERGVIERPDSERMAACFGNSLGAAIRSGAAPAA
jgi:methylthioribose-1-phosphate isomerase